MWRDMLLEFKWLQYSSINTTRARKKARCEYAPGFLFFYFFVTGFSKFYFIYFNLSNDSQPAQPLYYLNKYKILYYKSVTCYFRYQLQILIDFTHCYITTIDNLNAQHSIKYPYDLQWPPTWLSCLQTQKG